MVYFKWSKQAVDSRIYQAVMADTSVLVKSNWEGIKRVKDGNGAYAFIAENLHLGRRIIHVNFTKTITIV